MGKPHIYKARVNAILDVDQFLHMNNAAYAVHFELARWELGVASGLMPHLLKQQGAFVVASMALRFRRELRPLQPFEIHTILHAADQRQMYLLQTLRAPGGGQVFAGGLCRGVLRKGKTVLPPLDVFRAVGSETDVLDALAQSDVSKSEIEALATLEKAVIGQ